MVRIRKKRNPPQNTTRAKGDILEEIVAEMHMVDGITVEKNVFLPTKNGNNRPREIDVLVTTVTSGLPIRIAIECKNENKKIGIEKIDAFIGKLQDVNIPPQLGIFVSSNGYTSGALIRAKDVGIKTLIFDGTESNLSETVIKAFQSTVYFLLKITNIQIRNNVPPGEIVSGGELLFFHDRK